MFAVFNGPLGKAVFTSSLQPSVVETLNQSRPIIWRLLFRPSSSGCSDERGELNSRRLRTVSFNIYLTAERRSSGRLEVGLWLGR